METLGQELRRKREEHKISMKEVADATRIGVRFLHAIESDDYTALPGGIYARSFIRAYAKYVGMDEEEAMTRYRKQAQADEPAEPQPNYQDFATEPSQSSLWMWGVALLLLVAGSAWATLRYIDSRNNAPAAATVTTPVAPANNATTAVTTAVVASNPQPTVPVNPAQTASVTTVEDGLSLSLTASGQSWISVYIDDQNYAEMLTLQAGETREFKANTRLKVTIGNLPAIQIKINGQTAKLPSTTGLVATNVLIQKDNYRDYVNLAINPNAKIEPKRPKPTVKPTTISTTTGSTTTDTTVSKPPATTTTTDPIINTQPKPVAPKPENKPAEKPAEKPVDEPQNN